MNKLRIIKKSLRDRAQPCCFLYFNIFVPSIMLPLIYCLIYSKVTTRSAVQLSKLDRNSLIPLFLISKLGRM